MKPELVVGDIRKHRADMPGGNLFEGVTSPGGATGAVDKAIGGAITAAIHDGDFYGKWGEPLVLRPGKGLASPRVLVVGLGKKEKFTPDHVRQLALPVMRMAKKKKLSTVASVLHGAGAGGFDPEETARFLALGAVLSEYEYDRYKSEKEGRVSRFQVVEREKAAARKVARGLAHGARLGEAINWGRDLVASPPGDLRPDGLARAARKIAGGKVRVRVYGRKEAQAWKMGGLIAVGKGSEVSPRLIVAEYRGGAGRRAAVRAAAALGIRRNIVAIVPAVENMPSGTAYRPGDVLRMMSGKTVEVLSTDAEGRLILADAITFATN